MSLNTRCPACETVFKVVPDQLRVSSGWVRCGRCAEVFDAATHMVSPSGMRTRTATPIVSAPPIPQLVPKPTPEPPVYASVAPENTKPDINLNDIPELSFVREAKNKAFWQQTYVVRSMLALIAALSVLLIFQMVFDQRHQLAAKYPHMQASLERFCSVLNCSIEPVKLIDALKIESSTFQKTQESALGDTFNLKVTLKNTAALPLAPPAFELSLTDANEKAVVRRILTAQDLGFQSKALAAQADWSGSLSLFISANSVQGREQASVTGYRLLAFYP